MKLAHQPKWAHIIAAEGHAGQWLEHVRRLNFAEYAEDPLPDSECRSIAKSCAKYSLRDYSEEKFSQRQTARITRRWHPGEKNYSYQDRAHTIGLMEELGYSQADLEQIFGISERTVRRDLTICRSRAEVESRRIRPDIP